MRIPVNIRVRQADLAQPSDANAVVMLVDSYAREPVGGGRALTPEVRESLAPGLRGHPTTLVLLALIDEMPVGVAVCFFGFSTFRARPLLNIHDLAVLPPHRGTGVGRALLSAAEDHARRNGCCKLTLEVFDGNARARSLYRGFGFDDSAGTTATAMRFLTKVLET